MRLAAFYGEMMEGEGKEAGAGGDGVFIHGCIG